MRLENLGPGMPGLYSTQSVHKQGAGFSQASQIRKKDEHIRGQRRFIEHRRFDEAYLFASLDVNAKVHEGKSGEMLWDRCIQPGIENVLPTPPAIAIATRSHSFALEPVTNDAFLAMEAFRAFAEKREPKFAGI